VSLKQLLLSLALAVFASLCLPVSATGTMLAVGGPAPTQIADSLPFAALIGLIAVGAILVFRKMIRDLF